MGTSAIRDDPHVRDFTNSKYLTNEDNEADLLAKLTPELRAEYESYGHRRVEPAFQDRVFILYQATGRANSGIQRAPKIVTTIRVLSFIARDEFGCEVKLLNESTNQTAVIGHVPVKLFEFPIFVAIPSNFTLRWDAHRHGGQTVRSLLSFLFVKCRNKADFFSKSNHYMETPNRMRELYSHLTLDLDLK